MRVIAGEYGRRRLVAPKGDTTRPTPDRLREALFSILGPRLNGVEFHDLYCGSGAVGIEALSRGALRCTFVESDPAALAALRENLKTLGVGQKGIVLPKRVSAILGGRKWQGIVFLDPPYEANKEYEATLAALSQSEAGLLLVQHDRRLELPKRCGAFAFERELKQGDNCVSFYGRVAEGTGSEVSNSIGISTNASFSLPGSAPSVISSR